MEQAFDETAAGRTAASDRSAVPVRMAAATPAAQGGIGEPIAAATAGLIACGEMLGPIVGRRMRTAVQDAVGELRRRVFKVAVIGQTKAGKSSLVNAMLGMPGFLPADPNPWTSVVTRLHFGDPAAPRHRMSFQFFTEAEWRDLAEGGGPLAAMIDRLVPEAGREELIQQLGLVRRRVEQRLGPGFRRLLGKEHRFATISDAVLERYVCGGDGVYGLPGEDNPGRHADITKLADLFLEPGPFACPTAIIDTPGVNDPLLVRDEMTHRHLGDADLCIVVLNAQQALSTVDLDLLRLLHGLHRDRIIVFVNRIDLLGDVIGDCDKVIGSIRNRLAQTFTSLDIPIIGGSARWGEYAEHLLPADIAPLATPSLTALGRHLDLMSPAEPESWLQAGQPDLDRVRHVLRQCSGMPALRATVADLLVDQPGRHAVERTRVALAAVIHSAATASTNELRALEAMGEAVTGDSRTVRRQLARIVQDFQGIEDLACELSGAKRGLQHDIVLIKDIGLQRLSVRLEEVVEAFAEAEAASLEAATSDKPAPRMWRCDINPLRQTLAKQFLLHYRRLVDQLLELQDNAAGGVRARLDQAAPGAELEMGYRPPHLIDPSPSIAALGQVIALDLGRPWFEWWKHWRQSDHKVQTLKRLIRTEFQPVVDQLIDVARAELDPHAEQAARRFEAELKATMRSLRSRAKHFAKVYVGMLDNRQERSAEELMAEYRSKAGGHRRRLGRLEQARQQLEKATSPLR